MWSASTSNLSAVLGLDPSRRRDRSRRQSAPPTFQANTILPVPTEGDDRFIPNLERRQRNRYAAERSIVLNQVGSEAFSDRRRSELDAMGAGYLARIYGLRTAERRLPLDQRPGLRLNNEFSSAYQRSVPFRAMIEDCETIWRRKGLNLDQNKTVFVHSKFAAERLRQRLAQDGRPDSIFKVRPVVHGLVAVCLKSIDDARHAESKIAQVGATPSSYEIVRQRAALDTIDTVTQNPNLRNDRLLKDVLSAEEPGGRPAFTRLPQAHPMRPAADSVKRLVEGLQTTLAGHAADQSFQQDPLIGNALGVLRDVVQAAGTMTEDSARFFSAYQAIVDEVFIVLAARRPYGQDDFKAAAQAALHKRIEGSIDLSGLATISPCLVSSGMEAITLGLDAARKLCGQSGTSYVSNSPRDQLPDYFEVPGLFVEEESGAAQVLIAPLNPSTPRQRPGTEEAQVWNPQVLCDQLKPKIETARAAGRTTALVLDASVELPGTEGKSDLRHVLAEMHDSIADGSLRIVLCKSYQKFPSLASGKVMAGSVTILAKDDTATQDAQALCNDNEAGLDWIQNADSQLATHFIQHADESEFDLVDNAARNAGFIAQHLLPSGTLGGFGRFQAGLPFGIIENAEREIYDPDAGATRPTTISDLIGRLVEPRASFGFLETTSTTFQMDGIPVVRIAVGQESQAELVEKFYGLGKVLENVSTGEDGSPSELHLAALTGHAEQVARDGAETVLATAAPEKWAGAVFRIARARTLSPEPAAPSPEPAGPLHDDAVAATGSVVSQFGTALARVLFGCGGPPDIAEDDLTAEDQEAPEPDDLVELEEQAADGAMFALLEKRLDTVLESVRRAPDQQKAQEALAQERGGLRELLRAELERVAPAAERTLAENLTLVASAFAPVTTAAAAQQSDIDAMRITMIRDPAGLEEPDPSDPAYARYIQARYCINMVAGTLAAANAVFGFQHIQTEDRAALEASCVALLGAGAPGVSPAMRSRLLEDWTRLHDTALSEAAGTKDHETKEVEKIVRMAQCTPHPEDRAKMLQAMSDEVFALLADDSRRAVCDALVGPLDMASRPRLIRTLMAASNRAKAESCIAMAIETLGNSGSLALRPDQLGQVRVTEDAPTQMDDSQREQARRHLLAALFPEMLSSCRRRFGIFVSQWSAILCPDDIVRARIDAVAADCETLSNDLNRGIILTATRIQAVLAQVQTIHQPYGVVRDAITPMLTNELP